MSEYQTLIEEAGFEGVEAADVTKQFIDFSEAELKTIQTLDIDQNVREELTKDWQRKSTAPEAVLSDGAGLSV